MEVKATASADYARRLQRIEGRWWKRLLGVQLPYRWNLRRQQLGRTLDVGCGIGRNLAWLAPGSVGVDHNVEAVAVARQRGLRALTVTEWLQQGRAVDGAFDSLLLAHLLEHLEAEEARAVLEQYLPWLKPGGTVFLVCPQEAGFASDPTHVRFLDGVALAQLARDCGLVPGTWFSFPLPRRAGHWFRYNEFCLRATRPDCATIAAAAVPGAGAPNTAPITAAASAPAAST